MTYRRELVARLRRLGYEKESIGDSEVKERCYHLFLDEAKELVSERLLANTDDNMLYILYSRWTSWCCEELSYEDRQQMIMACFPLLPTVKRASSVVESPKAENVRSIFGG